MSVVAGALRTAATAALPCAVVSVVYGQLTGRSVDALLEASRAFVTVPGRKSRVLALALVLLSWKSLPLAWTARVWYAMLTHLRLRPFHAHTPAQLFAPVVTRSHASLLEVDYKLHLSNSTYFANLDVARAHAISHLLARGCHRVYKQNITENIVPDPRDPTGQKPARGRFGAHLGAVHCSFRRSVAPWQEYEMWTRVLSWDRKWMYILTHFVEKGANDKNKDWQSRIFATAMSKYVWKIGRITVHPTVVMEQSGLLPERPGGWLQPIVEGGGDDTDALEEESAGDDDTAAWDWTRTERERARGMRFARHMAALDGAATLFDGDEAKVLGHFGTV